jgi:hypothetical protein
MERYLSTQNESARTTKNKNIYDDLYNNNLPSSNVSLLDNESEIDISKINELVQNREGYKRVKEFESVLKPKILENDKEEYDIYEDIDNKIYDINMILEEAKSKRGTSEREKYRNLQNTQYNILSKLDLNENEEPEIDEMVTDFFTKDKAIKELMDDDVKEKTRSETKTSVDLFEDLKGNEDTILTEAISENKVNTHTKSTEEDSTFYTNHLSFTKEDFEDFQNLQTTVKKNNLLIKVLITILTFVLAAIVIVLIFAIL